MNSQECMAAQPVEDNKMVDPSVRMRSGATPQPHASSQHEEAAIFAAALAAALVEHRRASGEWNELAEADASRSNWRLVARLERLRGRA